VPEPGALLAAAELGPAPDHALISQLALDQPGILEATGIGLYLKRLPMATLDLLVLRHRPGFVQQADVCIATPALRMPAHAARASGSRALAVVLARSQDRVRSLPWQSACFRSA
jgi:hypothetical protein